MNTPSSMRRTPQKSITVPVSEKPVVAVFDGTDEITKSIALIMEDEGYRTIAAPPLYDLARDRENRNTHVQKILGSEQPHVFIIDIGGKPETEIHEYVNDYLLQDQIMKHAKIIFTSTDEDRLQQMRQLYEDCHIIQKPFDLEDLVGKVQQGIREVSEARLVIKNTEPATEISQPALQIRRRGKKYGITNQESTIEIQGPPLKEN